MNKTDTVQKSYVYLLLPAALLLGACTAQVNDESTVNETGSTAPRVEQALENPSEGDVDQDLAEIEAALDTLDEDGDFADFDASAN